VKVKVPADGLAGRVWPLPAVDVRFGIQQDLGFLLVSREAEHVLLEPENFDRGDVEQTPADAVQSRVGLPYHSLWFEVLIELHAPFGRSILQNSAEQGIGFWISGERRNVSGHRAI